MNPRKNGVLPVLKVSFFAGVALASTACMGPSATSLEQNEREAKPASGSVTMSVQRQASLAEDSKDENLFVGTSADNQTYSGRVWGWDFTSRDLSTPSTGQQWTAFPFCDIAVTLSAKVGISGGLWTASYYYADTISVSNDRNGITASRVLALAGGDDSPALLVVDALGFQFIEFELTRSGGTAASINGAGPQQ